VQSVAVGEIVITGGSIDDASKRGWREASADHKPVAIPEPMTLPSSVPEAPSTRMIPSNVRLLG
jgi:hypothetical protein